MARRTWVQDPVTLKLVPKDEYIPRGADSAPFVLGDIQPYRSMVDGSIIQGRRQHREHLRQHGCIEVGNEKLPTTQSNNQPTRRERETLRRNIADVLSGYGY